MTDTKQRVKGEPPWAKRARKVSPFIPPTPEKGEAMRFFPREERLQKLDEVCTAINQFISLSDERHGCDAYSQWQAHLSISEHTELILMGDVVVYGDDDGNHELTAAACLREFAKQLRDGALLCGTIEMNYPAEETAEVE